MRRALQPVTAGLFAPAVVLALVTAHSFLLDGMIVPTFGGAMPPRQFRRPEVTKWARQIRTAIAWVAMALAAVYGFLNFSSLPYGILLGAIDPKKLLQIIIIFYYFLWVWGVNHDTNLLELVYAKASAGGKLRPSDISVIILIFIVSMLLVWSIRDERRFAGVLTAFFVVNIFAWRYLLTYIRPAIAESSEIYESEEDFFALERLHAIVRYISGQWQWLRFAAMGAVLAFLDAVTFFSRFREFVSDTLSQTYPKISSALVFPLLPDLLFIIFIIVEEGWIWNMRMRTDLVLTVTNDLERKYKISPLS